METPRGWFSIRQVADHVGVTTQLIRKWEQRYRLPQPRRLPNGYRVYSESDIERLVTVRRLTEQGYSVQNAMIAVSLDAASPSNHGQDRAETEGRRLHDAPDQFVADLLLATEQGDQERILSLLQRAYHKLGIEDFSSLVLQPLLEAIGVRWSRKMLSEYQEHLISTAILNFLQRVRASLVEEPFGPLVLCSTVPYERHEITLQILMIRALLLGWRVAYLGASPAPGAIAAAVVQLRPEMVILSITTTFPLDTDPHLIRDLGTVAADNPATVFWMGRPFTLTHAQLDACPQILQTGRMEDVLGALEQHSPYRRQTHEQHA